MSMSYKVKAFFGFVDEEETPQEVKLLSTEPPVHKPVFRPAPQVNTSKSGHISEIRVEEPRVYEDSLGTASALRDGLPVILNLKHLDQQAQKRFIDFMCGTAFAVNGKMIKIGEHIFLFTPPNVSVDSGEKNSLDKHKDKNTEEREFFTRHGA
jgi:cell division inhibitor SepF